MAKEKNFSLLKGVFGQILALSEEEKAYLIGYLLISPWHSLTFDRYRAGGEGNGGTMLDWLNDRLRYLITSGKEGSKSILCCEEEAACRSDRKEVTRVPPSEDPLLQAYSAAVLVAEANVTEGGATYHPRGYYYLDIPFDKIRSSRALDITRGLFPQKPHIIHQIEDIELSYSEVGSKKTRRGVVKNRQGRVGIAYKEREPNRR